MIYQKKYSWRINNQPVDPQAAGEHLEKLASTHNSLSPQIVLDDARHHHSILHNCFEWDDSVAAEKFRIDQARHLIANLVVSVQRHEDDNRQENVRAFVSIVPLHSKGQFLFIRNALNHHPYRQQLLLNAISELQAFKKKYALLQELTAVFDAIDALCDAER